MAEKNLWDSVLSVLTTVAPTLATAVGGPFAGQATSAIMGALGLTGSDPAAAVAAVAAATPDQLLALKKADNDFATAMEALDISRDKLVYDDRASARVREAAVKDITPSVLAYGLTLGFFGLIGAAIALPFPEANQNILTMLMGSIGTAWVGAMAYYFGSTAGSREKNTMLANSVPFVGKGSTR